MLEYFGVQGASSSTGHIMVLPWLQYLMVQSNVTLTRNMQKKKNKTEFKNSSTLKYMHLSTFYEMSEAEAASSKLIPEIVPSF